MTSEVESIFINMLNFLALVVVIIDMKVLYVSLRGNHPELTRKDQRNMGTKKNYYSYYKYDEKATNKKLILNCGC